MTSAAKTAQQDKQVWFCRVCNTRGAILYEEHDDIMSVIHLISQQHQQYSPGCDSGNVQVMIEPKCTKEQIADIMAIPQGCVR